MAWVHKARNPGLWCPGRQPTGEVKVDRTHPLARDLVFCCLLRGGTGVGSRNLVTGVPVPPDGANTGMVVTPDGVAYRTATGRLLITSETYGAAIQHNFTLAARIILPTAGGLGICSVRNTSGQVRQSLQVSGATPTFVSASSLGSATATATTITDGVTPLTLCGATRSNTAHEFFVNGRSEAAASFASIGASPGQRSQIIIGQSSGADGRNGASFLWVMAWARDLSAAEAALLHHDPYSMLIPAG